MSNILTVTGRFFYFLEPERSEVNIEDIAHALSRICRFNGHTREFYSVAQHSVLVSWLVSPENALYGMLHDGSEAYLGDMTKPLKMLIPQYQSIERRVQSRIYREYGLDPYEPNELKVADMQALGMEKREFMPHIEGDDWECLHGINIPAQRIKCMTMDEAEEMFLNRFEELQKESRR